MLGIKFRLTVDSKYSIDLCYHHLFSLGLSVIETCFRPGVGKVRPAGQIQPTNSIDPFCGGSSLLAFNPAHVLLPNAPKDE